MQAGGRDTDSCKVTFLDTVEAPRTHQGPHELTSALQAKAGSDGVSAGQNEQS